MEVVFNGKMIEIVIEVINNFVFVGKVEINIVSFRFCRYDKIELKK